MVTTQQLSVKDDDWWNTDAPGHVPDYVPHRCCDCGFWTGNPGNMPNDLLCAVNITKPSTTELEWVDFRKGYARHYCKDFEQKQVTE